MAVQGDTVFLGLAKNDGDELVAVDASDPLTPHVAWGYEVDADVNALDVTADRVFLATSADDRELVVVDVASRATIATFDVPGTSDGVATYVVAPQPLLVWITVADDPAGPEAHFVNLTDFAAPVVLSSLEALGEVRKPAPPDPVTKGYLARGSVVDRGRGRVRPDLTFLAVNGSAAELHVVSNLDDGISIPDVNGDGVHRLACLGDSNTFVILDKNPGSWCHHLEQSVWNASFFVRNHSFLGARMTPAPTAEAFEQLAEAIGDGADLAIAAFGTNDVLSFTPSEIVDAAHALVDVAAAAGVSILLATPTTRYDSPLSDREQRIADTSALMRAAFPGDMLLDFNAVVGPAEIGPDSLHVNASGVLQEGRLARDRITVADATTFDDPCAGRTTARKARLRVANVETPPGDERLFLRGVVRMPNGPSIDPVSTGSQVMLIGASDTIVFEQIVPAGAYDETARTGWKTNRAGTAFRYESEALRVSIVAAGKTGTYAVRVRATGESIPATPDDLPLTGSVLLAPDSGACAAMEFPGGRVPRCRIGHGTLSCR